MEALEAIFTQAAVLIVPAFSAWAVAWFRAREQRAVVEQATIEAEAMGHREGASGEQKKQMAMTLSSTRMRPWVRPSPERLGSMVEDAVPNAAATVPPPKPG